MPGHIYLADVKEVVGMAKDLLVLVTELCLNQGLYHKRRVPQLRMEKNRDQRCRTINYHNDRYDPVK